MVLPGLHSSGTPRLSLGVRSIAAALMLTLQLRPVFGLVLCMGLGSADVGRMEDGCPMGEQQTTQVETTVMVPQVGQSVLTTPEAPAGPHGCALADVCTLVTAALFPQLTDRASIDVSQSVALRPSDPAPDLARFAPPTPPPNS